MNNESLNTSFGDRLKELAAEFGGISALARKSGVALGTLQKHVQKAGATEPRLSAVEKILRATGADGTWLITGQRSNAHKETERDQTIRDFIDQVHYPKFELNTYLNHLHPDTTEKRLINRTTFDYSKLPFPTSMISQSSSDFLNGAYPTKSGKPTALVAFKVRTTELMPTFSMGHTVLIDLSDCEPENDYFVILRPGLDKPHAKIAKVEHVGGSEFHFTTPSCSKPGAFSLREIKTSGLIVGRVVSLVFCDPQMLPRQ